MEQIAVGIVRGKHGLKGEIKVKSFSGESGHFFQLSRVTLKRGNREKIFTVEAVRGHNPALLLKLEGINTPEDAAEYGGWEVWTDREQASPLSEGEYYVSDLCRCRIKTGSGKTFPIRDVWEGAPKLMLEIETEHGSKRLIPFQSEFVGKVDLAERTVELLADWLLE
jgi:16S rRNA processing protein RimM